MGLPRAYYRLKTAAELLYDDTGKDIDADTVQGAIDALDALAASDVDHGLLVGLADDDHAQYLLADGARTALVLDVTGDITVAGSVDGRDVAADGAKLDAFNLGTITGQTLRWNQEAGAWLPALRHAIIDKQTGDYAGPTNGQYTLDIVAAEHGLGTLIEVRVWVYVGNTLKTFGAPNDLTIDLATGDFTVAVASNPDSRAAVRLVVTSLIS